jgi:hypothetical protein
VTYELCPICGAQVIAEEEWRSESWFVICHICGRYWWNLYPWETLPPELRDVAPFLSAATRQASERGRPLRLNTSTKLFELAEPHRTSTVSQKIDKLLHVIGEKCKRPGQRVKLIPIHDYPLADCKDHKELVSYIRYLGSEARLICEEGGEVELTIAGWQQLEPTLSRGGEPGRCFVAMWFDDEMDDTFTNGIEPGVRGAGYSAYRDKHKPTNDGVVDRLLSEIRRAQFVVAEFTGHRNNVYYEAGFAQGIGRTVIRCCHKDHIKDLAFDTRHFHHISWETPADLAEQLEFNILALIGPFKG